MFFEQKRTGRFWRPLRILRNLRKAIPEKLIPTFGLKMKGKLDSTLHFDGRKWRDFGIVFSQQLHFN
jgi:hypothetical protein